MLNAALLCDKASGICNYNRLVLLNLSYGVDFFVYWMNVPILILQGGLKFLF